MSIALAGHIHPLIWSKKGARAGKTWIEEISHRSLHKTHIHTQFAQSCRNINAKTCKIFCNKQWPRLTAAWPAVWWCNCLIDFAHFHRLQHSLLVSALYIVSPGGRNFHTHQQGVNFVSRCKLDRVYLQSHHPPLKSALFSN